MEAALVSCLRNRNFRAKESQTGEPTWTLALVDQHFFRLQLEHSSPSSAQRGMNANFHGSSIIELDVSVPSGFGTSDEFLPHDSFLATLPGSAEMHLAVPHSDSATFPINPRGRSRPFSPSEWENVQDCVSQLVEKFERIAAAATSDSTHPARKSIEDYLHHVMDAVEVFGGKVVAMITKAKGKGPAGKGKQEVCNLDSEDEDESMCFGAETSCGKDGDDDVVEVGFVSAMEAQVDHAENTCILAQNVYKVLPACHNIPPPAGSLLRWCSVTPVKERCMVVMAFDVHGLAAGNLEAVQSFGLLQPLLIVLMQFSHSDWKTWKLDCSGGLTKGGLPKPDSLLAFQARSAEEAQERIYRHSQTQVLEAGVRNDVPLEWWGTAVEASAGTADADDVPSTGEGSARKRRSLESPVREERPFTISSWVNVVVESVFKSQGNPAKSRLDPTGLGEAKANLEAVLPKLQLVIQDQVKEQQKKALQKSIPGMIESFMDNKMNVQDLPQEQQPVDDEDYLPRTSGNPFLLLMLFVANNIRCQHLKCQSCGVLLPASGSRLRSCTNSLCLFSSEELGSNMCVLSELHSSVEAADFQLDLASSAAQQTTRDVFEPFPSFLLKNEDQQRGRAGWFEGKDSSTNNLGVSNKDLQTVSKLLKCTPPLDALMKASSTEASLKLQLSAVWVGSQVLRTVPQKSLSKKGNNRKKNDAGTIEGNEKPLEEYMKCPFQVYDLLRFVFFTNRLTLMPLQGTAFQLPISEASCVYQFMVLKDSPERQACYEQRKKEFTGQSTWAFHGSNGCNWFSILRNGLRSMSHTTYMSAGASYGEGIYLATHASTSLGYAQQSYGRTDGKLAGGFRCLAICEVLQTLQNSTNGILVVPKKDELNVFVRYLLVLKVGVHSSSWQIVEGGKFSSREDPGGGSQTKNNLVDLAQHSLDAAVAHSQQVTAEKEKLWHEREGAVRLRIPQGVVGEGRGSGPDTFLKESSDKWYQYEGEEEEEEGEEEMEEEYDAFEDDEEGDIDYMQSIMDSATKIRDNKENEDMNWDDKASSVNKASSQDSHAVPELVKEGAASARGSSKSSGKAGAHRTASAMKAVQQELRKLAMLERKGNDSLKKDCFKVTLPDDSDLFTWRVTLRPPVFAGSTLEPDLHQAAAKRGVAEVQVELEVLFPDDFPFQPPFLRVVSPRFRFHTGHITVGGSICMELLTTSGWSAAYTMEAVLVQIIAEMCAGEAKLDPQFMDKSGSAAEYSMREARDAFARVAAQHGWRTS